MRQETWGSFWGELLLLRCHAGSPARWTVRRERAARLLEQLNLHNDARVLDLGCGDGLLDICLAERGAQVTAVDRIAPVVAAARAEPGAERVQFLVSDLRDLVCPEGAYDAILAFEMIGLMSREDERSLLRQSWTWLAAAGQIVVECPAAPSAPTGESQQQLDDGLLRTRWTYDSRTRMLHMVPTFETLAGETIELFDPYDPAHTDGGVRRYVYSPDELADLLTATGYAVRIDEAGLRTGMPLIIGCRA